MRARILVVDDDRDGREAMAGVMELWGYDVCTAESGTRALEVAATRAPDVVILDLGLPDMPGEAVCAALKARPSAPFVIAYSGYHRLEEKARAAGCDAFVLKPQIEELKRVVAESSAARKRASADDA